MSKFFKKCPKIGAKQCFGRARKINLVDLKKKKGRQNFGKSAPPPPPRENPRSAPDIGCMTWVKGIERLPIKVSCCVEKKLTKGSLWTLNGPKFVYFCTRCLFRFSRNSKACMRRFRTILIATSTFFPTFPTLRISTIQFFATTLRK